MRKKKTNEEITKRNRIKNNETQSQIFGMQIKKRRRKRRLSIDDLERERNR